MSAQPSSSARPFRWQQPIGSWRARGAQSAALRAGLGLPCPPVNKAAPKDDHGFTLWHYWANSPRPHESFAQLHRRLGDTHAHEVSQDGTHPWHYLLHHGHVKALDAWAKAFGAIQEIAPNQAGDTLAHAAAWSGEVACLAKLSHLDMAHINHTDDKGFTPLIIAIHRGGLEAARALLMAGADPDVVDQQGRSAMHHAALYGDIGLLGFFEDAGGDAQAPDFTGLSASSIVRTRRNSTVQDLEGIRIYWARQKTERLNF